MAIAVEGYSLIGLKQRIAEKYPGGLAKLSQAVPNAMELADDDLWRCSFMVGADAERFRDKMQQLTELNCKQGPDPDVVIVSEFDLSIEPYCEWLQVARWNKGVIAWRVGTNPRSVVARQGWSPDVGSGLQFAKSLPEAELEFLRYEGRVSVYRDKRTGRELYLGRTERDPREIYQAATQTIFAHNVQPGEKPLSGEAADKVREVVAELEKLAQQAPTQWGPYFLLGKGLLALGNVEQAYQSLRQAYELESQQEVIPRELAGVCLMLGRADEAVLIGQKAAALLPDSADALGNLALAYLIAGKLTEASTTIKAALKLDATEEVNQRISSRIEDVARGKRPQPRNLADVMRG
jgi:tetratricopeptide (TPR) repeat protein